MAAKKSAQYPFQWPDGSWHSITWTAHEIDEINRRGLDPNPLGVSQADPGPPTPGPGAPVKGYEPGVVPGAAAQPFDPAFEAQKQGATWNIQTGDAEAGWQRDRTGWGLGYNADGSLNTANPYSQAQLLQDNYRRSQTGTNNSMAATGQLYSGARLNAQAHNDRVYAEGSSGLRDQAQNAYHQIGYGQLQNYGANSTGVSQGGYEALKRAIYGG